jgi:DNA integrity scanning protein DisA with diadenylate cyclase activity
LFVILDDPRKARELLSSRDLLHQQHESGRGGSKNQLHYLLRSQRVTELSQPVLETVARIDGSIVLDRDGNLLAFGAILRHSPVAVTQDEVAEGSRTAAAIAASQFGNVLKVSEDGRLSFYKNGHCVWDF